MKYGHAQPICLYVSSNFEVRSFKLRFMNGYFSYFEKIGKNFIQENFDKRFRQEAFFLETTIKLYSIVLGPLIGDKLYQYYDHSFYKASLFISSVNSLFILLFFICFVVPDCREKWGKDKLGKISCILIFQIMDMYLWANNESL